MWCQLDVFIAGLDPRCSFFPTVILFPAVFVHAKIQEMACRIEDKRSTAPGSKL
jgi:hypothetical protein